MALRFTLISFLTSTLILCVICEKQWAILDAKTYSIKIKETEPLKFIAVATFSNTVNQTGWAKLDVQTFSGEDREYNDSIQAYAAGFIEGHITRSLISMHWKNTGAGICPEPLSNQCMMIKAFLEDNMVWMLDNIKSQAKTVPFWYHVQLYLEQMAGLQDGYAGMPGRINNNIDVLGTYLWQVGGDMGDLLKLFATETLESSTDPWAMGVGHCSALLRLLPDYSDLYVAQDTWSELSSMLRILKRYSFELLVFAQDNTTLAPGNVMTFSSYPGVLMSGDDFYTISSGLLTQETTIGFHNKSLNNYIKPNTVLEGFRSMVANRLASSGHEWAKLFSLSNSGTYNNEWMIVDYKLFKSGSARPVPGLFILLEQIPGTILYEDMTEYLYKNMYFGSYNKPYFPEIFNKSGGPAMVAKYGDWFTYDKTPRALIFKRDVPNVKDLNSMIKLMRYNNFEKDPLSACNCTPPYSADNAIAARCDLNPANGTYPIKVLGHRSHVATDMKVTTYELFQSLSFQAVSSPTYDDLPPFQWSTSTYKDLPHVGHPDIWMFPVIMFNGADPMA